MTLFPAVMRVHSRSGSNHNPCRFQPEAVVADSRSYPSYPDSIGTGFRGGTLSGPEKVDHLSRVAREALMVSAEKSGVALRDLHQDRNGAPRPIDNIYWSLSHKPKYVAAVVSRSPIGIDVEEIKPRTESLFPYVASNEEWNLADRSWGTFFRYWTAKEAALKAVGIGIGGLKTCRVASVLDQNHIVLDYKGQLFLIEHLWYDNHIVSVVKDDNNIEWILIDARQSAGTA